MNQVYRGAMAWIGLAIGGSIITGAGCGADNQRQPEPEDVAFVQQPLGCDEENQCWPGYACCEATCIHISNEFNCGGNCTICPNGWSCEDTNPGPVEIYDCVPPTVNIGEDCSGPGEDIGCEANGDWAGCCADQGGDCENLATNRDHCGVCGNGCGTGERCEAGKCMRSEGQSCNVNNTWGDVQVGGSSNGVCYTGKEREFESAYFPEDEVEQLECCAGTCVNTAADDHCGECETYVDCTQNSPPNDECIIEPGTSNRLCGCDWFDVGSAWAALAEAGFPSRPGHLKFSDHFFGEVCNTTRSNTCHDNAFAMDFEGTVMQSERSIGCGCGTGPSCPSGSSCVGSGSSARCEGCDTNAECPYGQLCYHPQMGTNYCTVVGCDVNGDCTQNGLSRDIPGSYYQQSTSYSNAVIIQCVTENMDDEGPCSDNGSAMVGTLVTTPPTGYQGICVDPGVDPAYCGACGFSEGHQFTFRTRGPLDSYDMAYQEVCTEHSWCAGLDDNPSSTDTITCHSDTRTPEWSTNYYTPMPTTIAPY